MSNPIVITLANHKGGVGKTTITAHLAWYLNELGRETTVIDLDGQGNLTGTFLETRNAMIHPGGSDYLFRDDVPMPTAERVENNEHLRFIRASSSLDAIDIQNDIESIFSFQERVRSLPTEFVVIDTAPIIGTRLKAALAASSFVVMPIQPELYSVHGVGSMIEEVKKVQKRLNRGLPDAVAVCNMMVSRSKSHQEMIVEVEAKDVVVLQPYLSRHVPVSETALFQKPTWHSKARATTGVEWRSLMAKIVEAAEGHKQ